MSGQSKLAHIPHTLQEKYHQANVLMNYFPIDEEKYPSQVSERETHKGNGQYDVAKTLKETNSGTIHPTLGLNPQPSSTKFHNRVGLINNELPNIDIEIIIKIILNVQDHSLLDYHSQAFHIPSIRKLWEHEKWEEIFLLIIHSNLRIMNKVYQGPQHICNIVNHIRYIINTVLDLVPEASEFFSAFFQLHNITMEEISKRLPIQPNQYLITFCKVMERECFVERIEVLRNIQQNFSSDATSRKRKHKDEEILASVNQKLGILDKTLLSNSCNQFERRAKMSKIILESIAPVVTFTSNHSTEAVEETFPIDNFPFSFCGDLIHLKKSMYPTLFECFQEYEMEVRNVISRRDGSESQPLPFITSSKFSFNQSFQFCLQLTLYEIIAAKKKIPNHLIRSLNYFNEIYSLRQVQKEHLKNVHLNHMNEMVLPNFRFDNHSYSTMHPYYYFYYYHFYLNLHKSLQENNRPIQDMAPGDMSESSVTKKKLPSVRAFGRGRFVKGRVIKNNSTNFSPSQFGYPFDLPNSQEQHQ